MDSCGSNSQFLPLGFVQNLEIIEGKFYYKDTLDLIEYQLMSTIVYYLNRIMKKQIEASVKYDTWSC